ncbi:MAG: hypothetical protein DSY46_00510 [Hydrogenimonas sp.]|nr:MAG: hypothetical protein DSY46_00510 [Hydrogenimonas sp.]
MAITPLGGIIYVNQNMHVAASTQNMQFNRYDVQNAAAQAMVNEKQKIVDEVRPPEELHQIDPEREHTRQEADEQKKRSKKSDATTKKMEEESGITHDDDGTTHLDIHV